MSNFTYAEGLLLKTRWGRRLQRMSESLSDYGEQVKKNCADKKS
jgi:hypothetical protein